MAGRTIKFQLMLSPEEAARIDDWMFANRLKSRAEAIRQLCDRGTACHGHIPFTAAIQAVAASKGFPAEASDA